MSRTQGIVVAAVAAAVLLFAVSRVARVDSPTPSPHVSAQPQRLAPTPQHAAAARDEAARIELGRRLQTLEARLAEESEQRRALEAQVLALRQQLVEVANASPAGVDADETVTASQDLAAAPARAARDSIDYTKSAMERALTAAGLAPSQAEQIKRRRDELAMTEMYLRDQATREGWLDTPRFAEEMAALDSERTPIREELDDQGYDRYLFALGHTNRVIVNDVMLESVAAEAGLNTGDLILHYGDNRIFTTEELIAQTHQGPVGESVRLEIVRDGERLEIEVPRGPLGLRIGATQDDPERELR